ncbi:hypothetical protein [Arenimonas daejeonensis]|uniref:hypothetical protein n=1 Tax=Arenimonas daejeonensis TaxID=370777 RepID=UPI0011BF8EF8|nr:hypothetical protein [Arenimonas daejeonensis]
MVRVTFVNGVVRTYRDDEVIEIENYPPRDTPKAGWFRTREYPPEYRRCTALRINVLSEGHCVNLSQGLVEVAKIERLPNE